jgi:hypothetical protein
MAYVGDTPLQDSAGFAFEWSTNFKDPAPFYPNAHTNLAAGIANIVWSAPISTVDADQLALLFTPVQANPDTLFVRVQWAADLAALRWTYDAGTRPARTLAAGVASVATAVTELSPSGACMFFVPVAARWCRLGAYLNAAVGVDDWIVDVERVRFGR